MNLSEPLVVAILAVLQGVAEFLPISSSGHLVVIGELLGSDGGLFLNVVLHLGSLIAIVVFYWRRIVELLTRDRRVIPLLVVATIPAAVVGLTLKEVSFGGKKYDWILEDPLVAGVCLVMTGYLLLILSKLPEREGEYQKMGFGKAFAVGCAQAVALLPGISRSGSTIVAGNALGLSRQSAATWSFLMAIPAIGGAMTLESVKLIQGKEPITTAPQWLVMGVVISAVVGWCSLAVLSRMLNSGKLHWFAYWLIPFGLAIVVWRFKVMMGPVLPG